MSFQKVLNFIWTSFVQANHRHEIYSSLQDTKIQKYNNAVLVCRIPVKIYHTNITFPSGKYTLIASKLFTKFLKRYYSFERNLFFYLGAPV